MPAGWESKACCWGFLWVLLLFKPVTSRTGPCFNLCTKARRKRRSPRVLLMVYLRIYLGLHPEMVKRETLETGKYHHPFDNFWVFLSFSGETKGQLGQHTGAANANVGKWGGIYIHPELLCCCRRVTLQPLDDNKVNYPPFSPQGREWPIEAAAPQQLAFILLQGKECRGALQGSRDWHLKDSKKKQN